jgi:hypothetical protein
MERKPDSQNTASPTRPGRSPLWLRLLVAVASPVFCILLLEAILRLVGYGQPGDFFCRGRRPAGDSI